MFPVSTFTICFYYIPEAMRRAERNEEFYRKLSKVTVEGKKVMIDEGKTMTSYATNGRDSNYFWRQTMSNPFIGEEDVRYELGLIAEYCERAYNKLFN